MKIIRFIHPYPLHNVWQSFFQWLLPANEVTSAITRRRRIGPISKNKPLTFKTFLQIQFVMIFFQIKTNQKKSKRCS